MLSEFGRRLLTDLREELQIDAAQRRTEASTETLRWVIHELERMVEEVDSNNLPPKAERQPELARAIIDSWSLTAQLSQDLITFERLFRQL